LVFEIRLGVSLLFEEAFFAAVFGQELLKEVFLLGAEFVGGFNLRRF